MGRRTSTAPLRAVAQRVVEADRGAAAADACDLALTDPGMPGMTGWQDQVSAEAEPRRFVDAILPKPSRLEDLLRVIREFGGAPGH